MNAAELTEHINGQVAEIGTNIDRLKAANHELRERLKDIAKGAAMMMEVSNGPTLAYVREVYRVATESLP